MSDARVCSRIMSEDRAIMKREITINTLVVCGFAARPPSLARFILPRWGKSFVCSTLPSSCPDRTYGPSRVSLIPSFVIRSFAIASYPTPAVFQPSDSSPRSLLSIPLSPLSRRWRLLDKISSLSRRESHWLPPHSPLLHILSPGYFLIGCHYYPYFLSLSIVSLLARSIN